MEPRIQYALTADGVRIAYWAVGDGPPLVHTPPPITHIEMEWQFEENRHWYESLARNRTLIRYDARGQGLSERDVNTISLETQILDLKAVVDRLSLETFDLFGVLWHGLAAIAYAAEHADAVSRLVLWSVSPRGADLLSRPLRVRELMDVDWDAYTEMVARVSLGWSAGDAAVKYAALIREALTPDILRETATGTHHADVSPLLGRVACPTLILHRRDAPFPPMTAVRHLAAEIADAHVALLDGDAQAPYVGDMDAVVRVIEEFLGVGESDSAAAGLRSDVKLTPRELEVLSLLVAGRSNRLIAETLVLSERTVARHIANIYQKTGVHGRAEVTAYAFRHELV